MLNTLLSLLLTLQLMTGAPHPEPIRQMVSTPAAPQESRLWWGLIDPEMSLWCAQLPRQESAPDSRILWDWSWRGFLAALFGIPVVEEVSADAAHA